MIMERNLKTQVDKGKDRYIHIYIYKTNIDTGMDVNIDVDMAMNT